VSEPSDFTIGDTLDTNLLLESHDVLDSLVFQRPHILECTLSLLQSFALLKEGRWPEERTNMFGTEGRCEVHDGG
jgi:hypothetical protein